MKPMLAMAVSVAWCSGSSCTHRQADFTHRVIPVYVHHKRHERNKYSTCGPPCFGPLLRSSHQQSICTIPLSVELLVSNSHLPAAADLIAGTGPLLTASSQSYRAIICTSQVRLGRLPAILSAGNVLYRGVGVGTRLCVPGVSIIPPTNVSELS